MWDYDSGMSDHELCAFLKRLNVAKVIVEFSGGGDEGGVNGIHYLDADDNEVKMENGQEGDLYSISVWDEWTAKHGEDENGNKSQWADGTKVVLTGRLDGKAIYRLATDKEQEMQKVLNTISRPVYDRYGSFAGEFHVYGEVIWDVAAGTHRMTGQESHETWSDISG